MDFATQQRLIKERFDKSFEMRTEKTRLEERLATLEDENQEAQNTIRAAETRLREIQSFPAEFVGQEEDTKDKMMKARFDESFDLMTQKKVLEAKLVSLEDEFIDVQEQMKLVVDAIAEVQTFPAELMAASAVAAPTEKRGRGRPRRSDGQGSNASILPRSKPHRKWEAASPVKKTVKTMSKARKDRSVQNNYASAPPSLYLCDNNLTPKRLDKNSEIISDRSRGIAMLSKDHPTIVKLDGRWTQIWCPDCGDNCGHQWSFFMGIAGLHVHLRRDTICRLAGVGKVMLDDVVKKCARYVLSDTELEDLRSGKKQVKMRRGGVEQDAFTSDIEIVSNTGILVPDGSDSPAPSELGLDIRPTTEADVEIAESRTDEAEHNGHNGTQPDHNFEDEQQLQHNTAIENHQTDHNPNNDEPQYGLRNQKLPQQHFDDKSEHNGNHDPRQDRRPSISFKSSTFIDLSSPDPQPRKSAGDHVPTSIILAFTKVTHNAVDSPATTNKRKSSNDLFAQPGRWKVRRQQPTLMNPESESSNPHEEAANKAAPAPTLPQPVAGPPPGSHNNSTVLRQPQNTASDVYYGRSVRPEQWATVSDNRKQRLMHVGRIEETSEGQVRSQCKRCQKKGFACRGYTAEYAKATKVSSCARCMYDSKGCVQVEVTRD